VLGLVALLSIITYLDRVCISVAGPRMQADLHISTVAWGWVTGAFTLAYSVFEIPGGALGDRIGPRRVLTRVVLWWSVFTSLTGAVSNFYILLFTRFCFGMGEAGAYPNATIAIARWFPKHLRAGASGVMLMAGQVGGAIAPLLVVPIQMRYGWRASFYAFGVLGGIWGFAWYRWFRDSPEEKPGVSKAELAETAHNFSAAPHSLPWRTALRSGNLWAIMAMAACYLYTYNFFQSWFHTYLVKGRGYSESDLLLSALPYVVAACANGLGGVVSDALVRKLGLKWGRRAIGMFGLGCAALFTVAVMLTEQKLLTLVFLSLIYGAITFQQPTVFGVCMDIGGKHSGVVTGFMNAASQIGGLVSAVIFGYLVNRTGSYNTPFIPMAALLIVGAFLWLRIDPTRELLEAPHPHSLIPNP
jgi:ACS family glucarate transporter-like MFS transporter